jgi:hypothetical protein
MEDQEDPATKNPFAGLELDDITDDIQTTRPRKRRSTQPTESFEPDLEAANLEKGLKFVAIVDLAKLDPCWGSGLDANRSLIEKHVDNLIQQIKQSDRRYNNSNRCQASFPSNVLKDFIDQVPNERRNLLRNYGGNSPRELVVLDITPGIFRLEGGQHRRAAVLKMNGLSVNGTVGVFLATNLEATKLVSRPTWNIATVCSPLNSIDTRQPCGLLNFIRRISCRKIPWHKFA